MRVRSGCGRYRRLCIAGVLARSIPTVEVTRGAIDHRSLAHVKCSARLLHRGERGDCGAGRERESCT